MSGSQLYIGPNATLGDRLLDVDQRPGRSHLVQPPTPKAPAVLVVDLTHRLEALEARVTHLEQQIDRLRWWARAWREVQFYWRYYLRRGA